MALWHYTLGTTLVAIIADERIRRASARVSKSERKSVWFSTSDEWEPTATKGVMDPLTRERRNATVDEMVATGGALVRIEVSPEVARGTWARHLAYLDPRMGDALDAAARKMGGNPAAWRVSYRDVPISKFLRIEASTDGKEWCFVGGPIKADGSYELAEDFVDVVKDALAKQGSTLAGTMFKDDKTEAT